MRAQQIAGDDRRLADPQRQRLGLHAVADAKHALLEQLPRVGVRLLGRVGRQLPGLFAKREIRVAGLVGRHHRLVAGQLGGDAEFLLAQSTYATPYPGGGLIRPRSQTLGPKMNLELLG